MTLVNAKDAIAKTKEFLDIWKRFNQMYKAAIGKSDISQEEEDLFLETKSVVARKFQMLADSLSIDRFTVDRTYEVINQLISLKSMSTMSEQTLKKIENDWHEAYISLNRLLGHLEAKKDNPDNDKSSVTKAYRPMATGLLYVIVIIIFALLVLYFAKMVGVIK